MSKRRMKQRVAVTLATVWLASIVGASVPSGETTAFSTQRSPGPSPDQYTPPLRSPRYHSQDDYDQDWMNDERSRTKVANRRKDLSQTSVKNLDTSISDEFYDEKMTENRDDVAVPNSFEFKDMEKQSDLEREAMRLSSMKVAFDEPIDSEISDDDTSEQDWMNDGVEEEGEMQKDEFVSDGTFEDEGPGSVEVYKLDLYKDRSILNPKPSRKSWSKSKSKTPKKVEAVDQISWKSKDQEETRQKTISRGESRPEELSPSRSLKDRIFGAGGVPELQVGCEGVEEPQRQKRSNSEVPDRRKSDKIDMIPEKTSAQLYIDDYDEEEDEDEIAIGGTDELLRILSQATTTTESPLTNENRGDMDPRVKTPGDLEKPKKKDKLPIRGDLGPSGDPNLTDGTEPNLPRIDHRRKLLSLVEEEGEEGFVENFRYKRSSGRGQGETANAINEDERRGRRGHHGTRRHREEKRRRRHDVREGKDRRENEMKNRNKTQVDKNEDHGKRRRENEFRENRLDLNRKNENSNSLYKLQERRKDGRNGGHGKRYKQQIGSEHRSDKERRTADENERKLADYRRRNTPIPREQRTKDNHRRGGQPPVTNSKIEPPQNIRLRSPPVYGNQGTDRYAENRRRRLQEQRQQGVGHINRAEYEQKLGKLNQKENPPRSTERPQNQREEKNHVYKQRSQQEIDRLYALPVSAYIVINQPKNGTGGPKIEGRFGNDEISFPGLSPESNGRQVSNFPSQATTSRPVSGPSPCTWAIMTCCSNPNRLATCFEAKGCYQGHWDDPCTKDKMFAALQTVNKYYGG